MPFLLLLLLMISCLQVGWQEPPSALGFLGSCVLTWLGVALVVFLAALVSGRVRQGLAREPDRREDWLRRYTAWRFYHLLALFTVYGAALYLLGWGWLMQGEFAWGPAAGEDELQPMIPGTEVFILAPFLVALILSWTCFYDAERAFQRTARDGDEERTAWSRWAYLGFQARHNLGLICVPLLLVILVKDIPRLVPAWVSASPTADGVVMGGIMLSGLACMPLVVRLVLGFRPLPPGPLRDRLLTCARRLRFRCSDVFVWDTRGGVANAMVVGFLPFLRYVVFTDRLLAEMTPDEIEAVFGHEIGHVKHRHMLYYLVFLVISLGLLAELWQRTNLQGLVSLTLRKDLIVLPLYGLIGAYIFIVFGFLSRRCERQADLYGCRSVSCGREDCYGHAPDALPPGGSRLCSTGIRTFISALEKVAILNGISRDRPGWLQSWQHSTIARRVEFLQRVILDPRVEAHFQRRVRWLKWASFVVLGMLLLLLSRNSGWAGWLSF
jgi:Zn-dependent protease with chaperone function